jgi:hypothetical protein
MDARLSAMGEPPERTADGRWIVVNGRRWRATDPHIPENLAAELRSELASARRAVRSRENNARTRVQDAKVALGERGEAWWDEPSEQGQRARLAAATRALLRHRDPDKTICPSDAARVAGGAGWRGVVASARAVAAELHAEGVVEIRQKGRRVDPATARGPLRIGRGDRFGSA